MTTVWFTPRNYVSHCSGSVVVTVLSLVLLDRRQMAGHAWRDPCYYYYLMQKWRWAYHSIPAKAFPGSRAPNSPCMPRPSLPLKCICKQNDSLVRRECPVRCRRRRMPAPLHACSSSKSIVCSVEIVWWYRSTMIDDGGTRPTILWYRMISWPLLADVVLMPWRNKRYHFLHWNSIIVKLLCSNKSLVRA